MNQTPVARPTHWRCGRFNLSLERPLVMGIVNVTPDSFSDGGRHFAPNAALECARRLVEEGADILDIGAESTRPGSDSVSETDELARLEPVLADIVALGKPVSVDTMKPAVMRMAAEAGAAIINDVAALRLPGALEAAAATDLGVCVMHMIGMPKTMQDDPRYDDVVAEVEAFLAERAAACEAAGIAADRIAIDPGFGFGKRTEHNLALLKATSRFVAGGRPVLIGVSRKGFIGKLSGRPEAPAAERVGGSVAVAINSVAQGAQVVRVHDVRLTVDALRTWREIAG
ncbi:dihydropteroate synthase [Derxia gummosa]|uniref:Dihydropteroate synthase n=1 Tax=Derxia gummosa DSM 723 TaxID=1121388 RepID=A0A8B6X6Z0_9BURK|nr:dihydropteroate synthase [Derxia gummosa]